ALSGNRHAEACSDSAAHTARLTDDGRAQQRKLTALCGWGQARAGQQKKTSTDSTRVTRWRGARATASQTERLGRKDRPREAVRQDEGTDESKRNVLMLARRQFVVRLCRRSARESARRRERRQRRGRLELRVRQRQQHRQLVEQRQLELEQSRQLELEFEQPRQLELEQLEQLEQRRFECEVEQQRQRRGRVQLQQPQQPPAPGDHARQ